MSTPGKGSGPFDKLLQHPVVLRGRKLVDDGKVSLQKSGVLPEELNSPKTWWILFGVVFVFTSVLLLQGGASSVETKMDVSLRFKLQEQKKLLRERTLMIDELRDQIESYETTRQKHRQLLKETKQLYDSKLKKKSEDFELLQQISDQKSLLIKALEAEKIDYDVEIKNMTVEVRQINLLKLDLTKCHGEVQECQTEKEGLTEKVATAKKRGDTYKKILEEKIVQIEALHKKTKEHYEKVNELQDKVTAAHTELSTSTALCKEEIETKFAEIEKAKDSRTCALEVSNLKAKVASLEEQVGKLKKYKKDHPV